MRRVLLVGILCAVASLVVRAQMSADDPSTAWDLRCEIREQIIAFVQAKHPGALPRAREESVK